MNISNKTSELIDEFRLVFTGRGSFADSLLPPVIFLIVNTTLGFNYALGASLLVAFTITGFRLIKGQSLRFALGGLGGVALAVLIASFIGRAEGFFVPNLISGAFTVVVALLSILFRRPMVAWTSFIARRWPQDWYWHPGWR